MGDENDVDFIDVEMDTFEEQDAGLGAGIGGGAGAGGGSFYRIPARAQQLQRTRMLTHVPFYPKLGAEDLEDAYVHTRTSDSYVHILTRRTVRVQCCLICWYPLVFRWWVCYYTHVARWARREAYFRWVA